MSSEPEGRPGSCGAGAGRSGDGESGDSGTGSAARPEARNSYCWAVEQFAWHGLLNSAPARCCPGRSRPRIRRLADVPVRPGSAGTYNVDHAYGTASRAVEYVEQLANIGVDEVICLIQMGTVPHEAAMETIRQWGAHVIPYFRKGRDPMTLDQQARAIVDALTTFFPDLGGTVTDPVRAREILALAPNMPVLVQLPSVVDRTIPGPEGAPEIPVRIYRPVADQNAVTSAIMFFHGGGFSICSVALYDNFCRDIAHSTGATVVSVEYRLAPETPYPGGLQDVYAATAWVASHADELSVDPTRLAVAGDSAGGNFAAVVSLMARDRAAQGHPSPAIAYQLLIYPSIDLAEADYASRKENATGYFLTDKHIAWFHDQYVVGNDVSDPYLSPINAPDLSGLPPACVITAEHDPLRDEGDAYAARLAAAGVAVDHFQVKGMFHGFLNLPHPIAEKTRAAVFAAVRAVLAPAT